MTIFECEYKMLKQYFLLMIDTFIEDEDYKIQWYKKLTELDEKINKKREQAQIHRYWNTKKTHRTKFKKFNNVLDFS